MPSLHAEVRDSHVLLPEGTLAVLSHHIVGGNILLPGVGYVEMAFAADADRRKVLSAVAVVRPCVLPAPGMGVAGERCTLRCTLREAGTFDIASLRSTGPLPHWIGYLANLREASSSYIWSSMRSSLVHHNDHAAVPARRGVKHGSPLPRASPSAAKSSIEKAMVGSTRHRPFRHVATSTENEEIDSF